jgi:anti-sigma factor RsiW
MDANMLRRSGMMMNCKEAILFMHEYLDGDLEEEKTIQLKQHMQQCSMCKTHYAKLEKAGVLVQSLKPVGAPQHLTTAAIMAQLPPPAKRTAWLKWIRRHPAASIAAVFFIVMFSSFLAMWDNSDQLVVRVSEPDQIVIEGRTVVVPEGHTIQGNLVVEKGTVQVDGAINGNLIVVDGSYALASTAHISGEITKVNQAVEWLWYKMNQFFTSVAE